MYAQNDCDPPRSVRNWGPAKGEAWRKEANAWRSWLALSPLLFCVLSSDWRGLDRRPRNHQRGLAAHQDIRKRRDRTMRWITGVTAMPD
jgi:hypothetical protein